MNLLIRARFSLVRVYLCQAGRSLRNALRVLLFGPRRSLPEALADALAAPPSHPSAKCKCACESNCEREAHDATCEWAAIMCRACVGGNGYCQRCGGDGTEPPNAPPLPAPVSSASEVTGILHSMNLTTDAVSHDIDGSFVVHAKLTPLSEAHRGFVAAMRAWEGQPIRVALRLRD